MKTNKIYQRHHYHSSIISHCVWLYYCFTLSYRDIELIMMEKGISVTYESIRYWCIKFGKLYAKRIKKLSATVIMFIWMKCFVRSTENVFIYGVLLTKMAKRLISWLKKKETVKLPQDLLKKSEKALSKF